MEGIILQNVDKKKFTELFNKVHKLSEDVQLLIDNKFSENVTPVQAAEEQNCSVQTIYAQIKKGVYPASKVGRKLLIKRSDLENALKEVKSLKYKR
ncbi:helix-turn-helix domain-containing protein [Tamlana fucoidanivorans]|uniref:Helix-turn-helix domain-containing protein n=1 Tax=Allotamlana fucoidanivorans TaxID=2583814 RepID=A0A5C4SLH1_9FLAO|nr:helix-turn-helix domain-containing protein [Tamlana fucoidanivorans]TNJ44522.1 helix-turn-helix domain-containing protein [Tamlana fucoidanivorans]